MVMVGHGLDRRGPKDSETAPNSFLTKINEKGFLQFATDIEGVFTFACYNFFLTTKKKERVQLLHHRFKVFPITKPLFPIKKGYGRGQSCRSSWSPAACQVRLVVRIDVCRDDLLYW